MRVSPMNTIQHWKTLISFLPRFLVLLLTRGCFLKNVIGASIPVNSDNTGSTGLPSRVREYYHIVFVDGISISHKIVILIACTIDKILNWYVTHSETTTAYSALLSRIAPLVTAVSDWRPGFRKTCKITWPTATIQRCLFHVYMTITNAATLHPRLLSGQQLLCIGRILLTGSKDLRLRVSIVTTYSPMVWNLERLA